ncbi:MAG: phosphonate C-P lyase system protein PhnH [Confluentimicrobium sp.]|jgi:alpha-D-ribose 1-methylphosphonate 5-triphosphate synthase subunit PhnH|uniref:Alpha-D-ribose 1-methylphosphonate 5-triphosphate synthase subunit PhnH n=1 Tax=Actibacterium naphthalenivorans TaxID=1614693 RepID=A0A840CGA2_9RHOB|nr:MULTISPECIES: phosphonate C-P lyase system protein PhnH [Actibacterium]ALG90676.1 carbon-phosphorus lyase [Actibacterium sp. EMB200-NS6]MBB4023132.1 alpha-D-ribose 1-methylphosphonate 5-triphosphate synthase subunit PhnH [Actibacterium naphthalenivorans]MBC57978.1 phosphonate C-P lyase system protein PhnH [Actibacterium sp.]MDY6859541.1 phosphonate C-P lyase system protein PhnH [Pseudomonadota bacterium]|tara:strand:+ start:748 stop:1347 length:600 start_codon:yes stop_codon:yes gene_type:complete
MQGNALTGGFENAPIDAAHAFRAALNAMARPGRIYTITGATPPAPLSKAAGTLLLTLADAETPVYLAPSHDLPELRDWLTFHTGAPLCGPQEAVFAVGGWSALQPLKAYRIGEPEYPDRSATLIVEVGVLCKDAGATLTGPGIEVSETLRLPKVTAFQNNAALFPLGLDFYFTAGDELAALPRTTKVTATAENSEMGAV